MNRFFAYNPVFGWVIALFITLFGGIALYLLPIEQYPNVAPPALNLTATYPGADAATLDRTVTSVIEKEMNGIENFLYMTATSRANGTAQIVVTFKSGTNLDVARTQVQDRLSRVEPRLPQAVNALGIAVTKSSSGFLMLVSLSSKTGRTPAVELGNYATTRVADELRRVPGVGDIQLFGASYAMRVWLDPEKLAGYKLTPVDVLNAVTEQNGQTPGGGLGDQPISGAADFNATILTQNRFSTADQFRQILLRTAPDGSAIRVGDVARVELGQDSYAFRARLNGREMAGMAIQLASGANALATANGVRAKLKELQPGFPPDVTWSVPFDTTPFITVSVDSVVHTLVEAMLLVFVVMFLFLQDWRATIIPAIVVPIALLGACLGLYLFGMSINVLSMFGMVVAIGILVDDAIVVVENVERIMREDGLNARVATVKAMGQITGAIVGITLVLVAVFLPMAFFPGSTGGIYRQFSVTLAISILFSALLALTLTPALCAALLKSHDAAGESHEPEPAPGVRGWPRRFFNGFNRQFSRGTDKVVGGVGAMISAPLRWLAAFAVVCVLTILLFTRLPGGFLPTEDQGNVFVSYMAPPGATMDRTQAAVAQGERIIGGQPQVRNVVSILGFNFTGQGQTSALQFVDLKPWDERSGTDNASSTLVQKLNGALIGVPQAIAYAIDPPPIQALGNATGFSMKIEDRSGTGGEALAGAAQRVLAAATKDRQLAGVRIDGLPPAPQLYVDIDRVKARSLGLQIGQVNQTLSIAFGSAYANDFTYEGNLLRVYLQADARQRMTADKVLALQVANGDGDMVPFSSFARTSWSSGAQQLERYNGYPSITISGAAAPGVSSGAALTLMDAIADRELKGTLGHEWTGTAYEEKQAGGQIGLLLGLSVLIVFLLLAALYRSWPIPLAVLLVVPFGVLGAVVLTMLRGFSADVYFNVGLITIIGLAAKNAILVVEFAIDDQKRGQSLDDATREATKQRLRPILMTSLAFILGMVPLVLASGAGAASRRAVGTGVMGGMIAATLFGIFFTPLFYYAVRRWLSRDRDHATEDADALRRLEDGHGREEPAHA